MKNKTLLLPLLSALLLPVAACGTTVLGGGGGGGVDPDAPHSTSTTTTSGVTATSVTATGAGGAGTGVGGAESAAVSVSVSSSASTGSGGGGESPLSGPGIAVLYENLPPPPSAPNDLASSVCQGGQTGALVLFWSNLVEACGNPFVTASASASVWQGILVLPPDQLQVGTVDLSTGQVMSCTYQFVGDSSGGGGGGPLFQGTIDIVAIDDVSITLNFVTPYDVTTGFTGNGVTYPAITLQGTYTVPRC
jgi:hypothetical protein